MSISIGERFIKILRSATVKIQNGHRVELRHLYLVKKPQTLSRCIMGDGNVESHAPFAERTDLRGLMLIYGLIGSHLIAQIAAQKWIEMLTDGC